MARLPQPPLDMSNESLHRSLTDLINFNRQIFDNGAKHPSFTQQQINNFTDRSFLGAIVYNSTTNESNVSYLNGSVVDWRPI